jgi:hypothetical protein
MNDIEPCREDQAEMFPNGQLAPVEDRGADSLLAVIYRAAMDPRCDLDRMERLFMMHREMENQVREREFDAAMSSAQGEMRAIAVDRRNDQTRSDYASYYALDKAIRAIYTKHGFTLSFSAKEISGTSEMIRINCRVGNKCGFARDYDIPMPADGKGAKGGDVMTKTHALGSAATYGMRYLLKMIFNLAIGGGKDDDDGNAAGGAYITDEQIATIENLIIDTKTNKEKFLKYMNLRSVAETPAKRYRDVISAIQNNARRRDAPQQKMATDDYDASYR